MSERITEAELRIVEGLDEDNRSALLFALRLVAEVRRFRALIAAFTDHAEIRVTRFYDGDHEGPDQRTGALLDEARAIREEANP